MAVVFQCDDCGRIGPALATWLEAGYERSGRAEVSVDLGNHAGWLRARESAPDPYTKATRTEHVVVCPRCQRESTATLAEIAADVGDIKHPARDGATSIVGIGVKAFAAKVRPPMAESTVRHLIAKGLLRARHIGRRVYIEPASAAAYLGCAESHIMHSER